MRTGKGEEGRGRQGRGGRGDEGSGEQVRERGGKYHYMYGWLGGVVVRTLDL